MGVGVNNLQQTRNRLTTGCQTGEIEMERWRRATGKLGLQVNRRVGTYQSEERGQPLPRYFPELQI